MSERLSLLLNALPAGVVVLDSTARISEANPVARSMLGEGISGENWSALAESRLAATDAPDEWQLAERRVIILPRPREAAASMLQSRAHHGR